MSAGHDNWYHERESAWLYARVAAHEPDPRKRELFLSLARAAERQAKRWEEASGKPAPVFKPTLRARIVARLLAITGPSGIRPALAAMKLRGLSIYDAAPMPRAGAPFPGHAMPTSVDEIGLRHKRLSGGNLRASVFGVNDGLVSNASLILGVAGAGASSDILITTGIAGLLAGALSMAAGEYVSVRSQREMYEYQIALERDELAEYPEEEAEELALIYAARGMEMSRARELAQEMISNPELALEALSREELGLNPHELGSPWGAALSSFASFAAGAALPVLPFLTGLGSAQALFASVLVSAAGLYAVGMAISLFTGRNAWFGGLRMLAIGVAAGLTAHLIGRALGVAIA
ncbi:MAG TPA: VIT1/CCC1 transporter family protein [Steroidobacteraceae bacterium]|nr:VIT1/CCC1 transporter family protein [Steroidobacteraceae bacterium]